MVAESQQDTLRTSVFSAYGKRHSDDAPQSPLAFNGEFLDPFNEWYLLGKGYRAYNPALMRFHTRDSLSPFSSGGVNPYGYCRGNPIALRDPTGHTAIGWSGRLRRPDEDITPGLPGGNSNVWAWIFVALGAAATVGLIVSAGFTFGATLKPAVISFKLTLAKAVSLSLAAAITGGATAAQAVNTANGDEEAGKWAMYLGIASIIPSVGAGAFGAAAKTVGHGMDDLLRHLARYSTGTMKGGGPMDITVNYVTAAVTGNGRSGYLARRGLQFHKKPTPSSSTLAPPTQRAATAGSSTNVPSPGALANQRQALRSPKPVSPEPTSVQDEFRIALNARLENKTASEAVQLARESKSPSQLLLSIQDSNLNAPGRATNAIIRN